MVTGQLDHFFRLFFLGPAPFARRQQWQEEKGLTMVFDPSKGLPSYRPQAVNGVDNLNSVDIAELVVSFFPNSVS